MVRLPLPGTPQGRYSSADGAVVVVVAPERGRSVDAGAGEKTFLAFFGAWFNAAAASRRT